MKKEKKPGKGSSHRTPLSSSFRRNPTSDHTVNKPAKSKHSLFLSRDEPAGPSAIPTSTAASSPPPFRDPAAARGPPVYDFHMLERRTIFLADGSLRDYYALPPDPPVDPTADKFLPHGGDVLPEAGVGLGLGLDEHFHFPTPLPLGGPFSSDNGPSSPKKKYGEVDEFVWHRRAVMLYGNDKPNPSGLLSGSASQRDYQGRSSSPLRVDSPDNVRLSKRAKLGENGSDDFPHGRGRVDGDEPPAAVDVNPKALKKAFLKLSKSINENVLQRKNYLEDGKHGPLSCLVCGRFGKTQMNSKEFADVHGLMMHTYSSPSKDFRARHLGLYKALCVLMGWNYAVAPDNSKAYQSLSADKAAANREDLILWPPTVIIHNTDSGRREGGHMEGMGNKEVDAILEELGLIDFKTKSMHGKEHLLGATLVKFRGNQAGLEQAERLVEFFAKENHGRKGWASALASQFGNDNIENNPVLVKVEEKAGKPKRIFYGYLATASDISEVDFETRNWAAIKSIRDFDVSN